MKPFASYPSEEKILMENIFNTVKTFLQSPMINRDVFEENNLLDCNLQESINWESLKKLILALGLKYPNVYCKLEHSITAPDFESLEGYIFTSGASVAIVSVDYGEDTMWLSVVVEGYSISTTILNTNEAILDAITTLLVLPNVDLNILCSFLTHHVFSNAGHEDEIYVNETKVNLIF